MKYCKNCGRELNDSAMFCPGCGGLAPINEPVSAVKDNIKERNIVLCIIFTILTFGLYGFYWLVKINDDILRLAREDGQKGVVVFLLIIITFGLYGFYWMYKMGNYVEEIEESDDFKMSFIYIILYVIGLGIVSYALIQNVINSKANMIE